MARVYDQIDSSFATVCSDVTLYSNSKGFFNNLADEIVTLADKDGWLELFESVADNEKINTVSKNVTVMESLNEVLSRIQPIFRGKDVRVSHERRLMAQTALKEGDLQKSLSLITQAVLRAPMTGTEEVLDDGISLALALWLRSEVLLRLKRPAAALEDLKLALKERLPVRMRAEYYWRMGHCYIGTGEPTRAKVSYELAGRLLGSNEQAKIELKKDIDAINYTHNPKNPPDKQDVTLSGGAKENLPALSKLVKIVEEQNKGRFAVANSNIKTGDILLVDSPYAACLLSDYYGTHCLHCFKRLDCIEDRAPVWCKKCSGVAFCSTECRDTALSTYHTFECDFLDLFIGSGMSILSHVALRMVTQAGLDTCLQMHSKHFNETKTVQSVILNDIEGTKRNKIKSRKERLNRSKRGLKDFEGKSTTNESIEVKVEDTMTHQENLEMTAAQIYALCSHSSQRRGADYLKRIIMGLFLTKCLKKSVFFNNYDKENLTNAENVICELIVRHLQLLQFNAHEIYETVTGEHQFSGSKPVYVAVGIYTTGALFNHECYPAVARYFDNQKIVLRATRPLQPGDVVSENYGPHFLMRNLKERQRMLSCRYWFSCECIACKEDWLTLKQMGEESTPFIRCLNKNCFAKFNLQNNIPNRCPKCSFSISEELKKECREAMDKCLAQYQEGASLIEEQRPQEAIDKLSEAVDRFHSYGRLPHKETHIAQESLRLCFASKSNIYIVPVESQKK